MFSLQVRIYNVIGKERVKTHNSTIISDPRIMNNKENEGWWRQNLLPIFVFSTGKRSLRAQELFFIYNSQGNRASYKTSITLSVIKSPFKFVEYRQLKIPLRWHILIRILCVIAQRFQLKRSELIRVSKNGL